MKNRNFGLRIRIAVVVALLSSTVFNAQLNAATTFSNNAANLTTVPQAAIPSMNAMTGSAQSPYTPTTTTPDYFGTPDGLSGYANGNFGNSPLPVSVLIQGTGKIGRAHV